MTERVDRLLGRADVIAGGVADALGHCDDDIVALKKETLDIQKEILRVESDFRQID